MDRQESEGLTGADCHRLQQVAGHLYRLAESPPAGIELQPATSPACMLVGDGPAMSRLRSLIERIAPRESNVLILGNSGTGKELVARAIHTSGPRRHGRFVAMDCGALSDTLLESELFGHRRGAFTGAGIDRVGLLEEAHDGTLFLDELANASAAFQTRLLRVLQEGEIRRVGENRTRAVDLRVIAATSGDLPGLVREGRFRGDLYYRINVLALTLPPLRQRCEDIPLLLRHFLAEVEARHALPPRRFSGAVLEVLLRYRWPGNVRELRNVVERAALMSTGAEITTEALPTELMDDLLRGDDKGEAPAATKTGEQRMIEHALLEADGERTRAARIIGWPRSKLYRRLHRYAIPAAFGRKEPQA
jgi:two-component system response regulator AtoC